MPANDNLVEAATALLTVFEGCHLQAYRDSGGVWTIGIGHTRDVHEGQQITYDRALELFAEDQAPLLVLVKDRPPLEAAALVSFGFNCGLSTLVQYLNGHTTLEEHVKDRKGNTLPGLVARRRLEALLIRTSQHAPVSA